jgi:tetratricopeptide (TPR) repeat protein
MIFCLARTFSKEIEKAMKRTAQLLAVLAAGLALFSATGCNKLKARDQLNKGVGAYKSAKYEEAINHFQQAVEMDPALENARLYLATAYAQQFIPGVDSPDNNRYAEQAVEQYKAVLEKDPKSVNSVKGIAYLYLQQKKFDDAKTFYRKALDIDPNDPEPYYSIGVIDWTQSYQPRMEERAKIGLKPEEALKDKKVCAALKAKSWTPINDGIEQLNKALQIRPDYDDAMAYMNLLYREKADVECDDLPTRAADLKTADDWVEKTMATKKAKAEKQPSSTGVTMDQPNK